MGGLLAGVMYSLVALGFVLIYKASGVFNYAQGSMVLFAALSFVGVLEVGAPIWLAVLLTVTIMVDAGLPGGTPGAAAAGEPGADHAVHGHHRHIVLPRRVRSGSVGQ